MSTALRWAPFPRSHLLIVNKLFSFSLSRVASLERARERERAGEKEGGGLGKNLNNISIHIQIHNVESTRSIALLLLFRVRPSLMREREQRV